MANQFIIRRTTAEWAADNPVLLANQLGVESNIVDNVETDTLQAKLGNGIDHWNDLPYWQPSDTVADVAGPSSSTDNAATTFDGVTGKLIKDGSAVNVLQKRAVESFTTTATAAGTTTLTVSSNPIQVFTGTTTQTVTLPVVTTLPKTGFKFEIINNSTGVLTVNSSGANLVTTIAGGSRATFVAVLLTGTTAASWAFTGGGNTPAIKEYAASIVGAGASNPTATEQWNTLGATVAITRPGGGQWSITASASVFTSAAKCNVQITSGRTATPATEGIICAVQWVSATVIDILLYDVAGAFADAASASADMPWSLKITVYP